MASCVRNIHTKHYQNLIIVFQVTVENVGDAFLGHSVKRFYSINSSITNFGIIFVLGIL